MSNLDKIRAVYRSAFDLAPDVAVDDLTYRGIPAWDSVGHMRLIVAFETEFDLMIDVQDVLDLSSFTKGLEILEKYGVK